jgi:hypothetical protein
MFIESGDLKIGTQWKPLDYLLGTPNRGATAQLESAFEHLKVGPRIGISNGNTRGSRRISAFARFVYLPTNSFPNVYWVRGTQCTSLFSYALKTVLNESLCDVHESARAREREVGRVREVLFLKVLCFIGLFFCFFLSFLSYNALSDFRHCVLKELRCNKFNFFWFFFFS